MNGGPSAEVMAPAHAPAATRTIPAAEARAWVERADGEPESALDELVLDHCLSQVDALALFDAADRCLVPGAARLVLIDRFALQRHAGDSDPRPLRSSIIALAQRRGWQGPVATGATTDPADSPLRFERAAAPGMRLHRVGSADAPAMRTLFAEVFGQPMAEAHWHWKYGDGRGRGIALSAGGRMLAHYGGTTRQVLWQGRPALACQVCDVMVTPEANRALVRKGPMQQVSATFLESELGWGSAHPLAYGFPSDRHHQLAERLGLYTGVDSIQRASWPARAEPVDAVVELLADADLAPGGRREAAVARLWQAMAASFGGQVIGVRDAAWLRYRYLQRPGVQYELLYLRRRWTRRPLGVVVLRRHEHHLDVLDLVAAPSGFGRLIAVARQRAAAAGLQRVDCWITASQLQHLSCIAPADFSASAMGITVPANIHTPGPVDEVRGRWFLLAGDADFT